MPPPLSWAPEHLSLSCILYPALSQLATQLLHRLIVLHASQQSPPFLIGYTQGLMDLSHPEMIPNTAEKTGMG